MKNTKDLIITNCPECGGLMDNNYCPCCEIVIAGVCPECEHLTWEYDDPRKDSSMGTYCSNSECTYTYNQYMTWEEIKECYYTCKHCGGTLNGHGVCTRCPETGEEEEPVAQCGCCGEWTEESSMKEGMCNYCFSVNVGE